MGLKEAWRALTKKENDNKPVQSDTTTLHVAESELFPIVRIPEVQLEDYRKIPLAGIGALGTAFAFLPESARQIVTTRTQQIATKETLFVGINPKGVLGFLRENQYGTVGAPLHTEYAMMIEFGFVSHKYSPPILTDLFLDDAHP